MKIIVFCDESSIRSLVLSLKDLECLFVVAHNRRKAIDLAESLNVLFLVHPRKNDSRYVEFFRVLQDFEPDLGICCSYGLKIEEEVIRVPHFGCVNFHGGILPHWRGANILNWVLIQGAKQTGVTAHFMTERIDQGPIICVKIVEIQPTDTALSLRHKLESITYPLIEDVIAVFDRGEIPQSKPQNESAAAYFPRRTPEDGKIRWDMTDLEIYNLIRALVHPWPGAIVDLPNNQTLIIDSYKSLEEVAALRRTYQPLGLRLDSKSD